MNSIINIPVSKCKKGMVTAEPVFNNFGGIVIGQDIELDDGMINKLDFMGITSIKVYEKNTEQIKTNEANRRDLNNQHIIQLKEKYNDQVNVVKDVVKDINSGKALEVEKIDNVVGSLTETFKKDEDVINCFRIVKDVDEYLYNHSINVSLLSALIGKWIGLEEKKVNDLAYAGLLHDIGKAKVSFRIINKKEELTKEEEEQLKQHVTYGYKMLESIPNISKDIALGVLMHHERIDGKGYMLGATGDQIHIYGRIIAIANKYDYYISKLRKNPFKVFENIRKHTFSELDPKITLTFLGKVSEYYIGDIFRLNTGEYGEVIAINNNDISRPLIRIDNAFVNLVDERGIEFDEEF